MSEKISQKIFMIELIFIVFPLSLLLLFATSYQIYRTIDFFLWQNIASTLFALIACIAVSSGLLISRTFIKQGSSRLQELRQSLWIFSFLGVTVSLLAEISRLLPPSPEYSTQEMFRNDFELFILGFPMLIPLIHLTLERFIRKEEKIWTDSKTLSAT